MGGAADVSAEQNWNIEHANVLCVFIITLV